jgi:hypothetical protein
MSKVTLKITIIVISNDTVYVATIWICRSDLGKSGIAIVVRLKLDEDRMMFVSFHTTTSSSFLHHLDWTVPVRQKFRLVIARIHATYIHPTTDRSVT